MNRVHVATTIMLIAIASLLGCSKGRSGPTGTISGKLTNNGQAPPAGTSIQFLSDNNATGAEVSADGSFTIMGVPVDSYKVMVTPGMTMDSTTMDPEAAMKMASGEGPDGKGAKADAFSSDAKIPTKFTDHATSGITFAVKEGNNDFTLDMKE